MNTIVRTLRVEELPEPLREEALRSGFAASATVELTVTDVSNRKREKTAKEMMAEIEAFLASRPPSSETIEDAVERVGKLRDEWER